MIVNIFLYILKQLFTDLKRFSVKDNKIDQHFVFHQKFTDHVHGKPQRLVLGIAIDAAGNQGKGHRFTVIFRGEL